MELTKRISKVLVAIGLSFLLSSCWIPESFEANVDIRSDGSYIFNYDGTMVFAMALVNESKGEELSEEDEAELKTLLEEIKADPETKEARYLGNARYQVLIEKETNTGERYKFLDLFYITPKDEGIIEISIKNIGEKEKSQLEEVGVKVEGVFSVTVADDIEIISHNATSEPTFFGLFGGYSWDVGMSDTDITMIVKVPVK